MEFWGVEIKAGEPLKVDPGYEKILHLSQASLGETKKDKGNDSVTLFLKFGDQKLVLGTLSQANFPQLSYDLVFEKEFELSHNWKNGSVYFCGYKSIIPDEEEYSDLESDSEEEDILLDARENGKPEPKVEEAKPAINKAIASKPNSSAKPKVKLEEPKKDNKSKEDDDEDDSDDDESDEDSEDDESDDEDMLEGEYNSDESLEDEDEETPKKAGSGKKRPTESATKTPIPAKKAKLATPQKTDGKKGGGHPANPKKGGGHTVTPHPLKQVGKTPNSDKSKGQTPKSSGQVSCKSCSKTFNSENALQSHSKAKHSDGK